MTVERAASSTAAAGGVFTPAMLHAAVKAADPSKGKSAFARGRANMQDLSEAGKSVLPEAIRDSGTTERILTTGALMGSPMAVEPATALGLGTLASLYTRPVQAMMRGSVLGRPQGVDAVGDYLRAGPAAQAAGSAQLQRGWEQ